MLKVAFAIVVIWLLLALLMSAREPRSFEGSFVYTEQIPQDPTYQPLP